MQNLPPVQRNHTKTNSLVLPNKDYSPGIQYQNKPRPTLISSNQQNYGLPFLGDESRGMYRSGNNSRAMNYYQPPMDNVAYQAYYQNQNMMTPPVESPYPRMSIMSPRLDHAQSPSYFPQPYYPTSSRTQVNTEGEEKNERLLDLIEKQTEVIGHINSKILVQETQKIRREQNDLKIKLKQLELENAMQQKEINAKLMSNYTSLLTPDRPKVPRKPENSPREKKSSQMIQVMSKLILGQEIPSAFMGGSQSHRQRSPKKSKFDFSEQLLKEMYSQNLNKRSSGARRMPDYYEEAYE